MLCPACSEDGPLANNLHISQRRHQDAEPHTTTVVPAVTAPPQPHFCCGFQAPAPGATGTACFPVTAEFLISRLKKKKKIVQGRCKLSLLPRV